MCCSLVPHTRYNYSEYILIMTVSEDDNTPPNFEAYCSDLDFKAHDGMDPASFDDGTNDDMEFN